jgi:hypothetical protein
METTNYYGTEKEMDIYEDIQMGFKQDEIGDASCDLLFNSKQDIESLLNQCQHSGKYSQEELILFIETVRKLGI